MNIEAKDLEVSTVDDLLRTYQGKGREHLLPLLHEMQRQFGWLPETIQEKVAQTLRVPLADIHGVIEFYSMFYREPKPMEMIRVCEDPACSLAGAQDLSDALISKHQEDGLIKYNERVLGIEKVTCLGMCEHAPAVLIGDKPAGNLSAADLPDLLDESYPEPGVKIYGQPKWLLKRAGQINPRSLADYENSQGYNGLSKALELGPEGSIELVEQSGILGRGGAMFPTGRKWRFARNTPGPSSRRHIIVNGDESEPGTFKDRCIMENDPFSIIEAASIAAYAVGAENGWIFVRGEYPKAFRRISHAVAEARKNGFLGKNIMGIAGFDFDIEVRLGAGAYICGEETALCEAIEGKRGFPRIRPPFPVTHGLFNQPTVINNVETLAAIAHVFDRGVDEWRSTGTEQSPGTKLFCLSGHIAKPGLYEVPFGTTIRELILMAGGVPSNHEIKAVLVGGAAGKLIDPSQLDTRLTIEDSKAQDVPLGSGVIMVFDQTTDLLNVLYQISRFFAHESCGKCFPCQLGTQRQQEILSRLAFSGEIKPSDRETLLDLGFAMTETSLCGLGQTAATTVISAIQTWPGLFA